MSLKHTFLFTKTHFVELKIFHTKVVKLLSGLWLKQMSKHTANTQFSTGFWFHLRINSTNYKHSPKKRIVQTAGRKETKKQNNNLPVFYMLKEFCQQEKDTHTFMHTHAHPAPAEILETLLETLQELLQRKVSKVADTQHTQQTLRGTQTTQRVESPQRWGFLPAKCFHLLLLTGKYYQIFAASHFFHFTPGLLHFTSPDFIFSTSFLPFRRTTL